MSVLFTLFEGKNLKSTQTLGAQDPYVLVSLGVDLGPVFGVSPDPAAASTRILDAPALHGEEWKSVVVDNGGTSPQWPEGSGSTHNFQCYPGADCIVCRVMNKNISSDVVIGEARIPLASVFQCGEQETWFSLIRESGRLQGEIRAKLIWTPPSTPPIRVLVPLTLEIRGEGVAVSDLFSLAHKLYSDVEVMAGKKAGDPELLAQLKAVLPRIVELFGEEAFPILKLGGAPIESVEPAAAQCGLKEHDIIVGYGLDHKVNDGGRGILPLVNGTVKWGRLRGESRAQALKELRQFDPKESVTLTVLRALPLKAIPDSHGLRLAYLVAPSSFAYEPQALSCIANESLAPLHPDVRPSSGRPFRFQAAPGLPPGVELSEEGVLMGVPTAPGKHECTVSASNGKGSLSTSVTIHVMQAPTELHFAQGHHVRYAVGQPITANHVTKIDGDGPFRFHCEPPPPPGLNIDASSGAFSGTPTEVCADSVCIVTASSPAGSVEASIIFSVLAPPTTLTYSAAALVVPRGSAIADVKVTRLDGSPPFQFTYTPTLPCGLGIDPSSGALTGVPTTEAAQSEYRIRAANMAGGAEFCLSLAVLEQPSGLSYQHGGRGAQLSYSVGCQIIENRVVAITGTPPMTFSCTPALPPGLQIDQTTGLVSGTPTTELEASMFEMVASNAVGATSCQLLLEVAKPDDGAAETVVNTAEATETEQPMEELQGPGADVKSFLERVGVGHKYDDFISDGWDSLDMVYAMSSSDLKAIGLSDEEADRVLAGQPSTERARDRRAMKRFMSEKGFLDLEPCLIGKGIKGLSKLFPLTINDLVAADIPRPRALALYTQLQSLAAPPPLPPKSEPVAPPAPDLLEPQRVQAGVGLTMTQAPPVGLWVVKEVVRGGAAAEAQCIAQGDVLMAVTPVENGQPIKVTPQTTLNDIRTLILGPTGSYVTLLLQRRGTRFEVPLKRAPTKAQPPRKHAEAEITIKLKVARATNLPAMDRSGTSDPYVVVQCNGQAAKTPVIWKTLNPVWNAEFAFRATPSTRIVLSVWDKDTFDPDDLIGKLHVAASDVVSFTDSSVKMGVVKGRLQTSDGGAAKGKDGNHSHLFLEVLGARA